MTFCFFRRIIFLLFLFAGERRKHMFGQKSPPNILEGNYGFLHNVFISSIGGFQGERNQNIFLWFFRERILTERDFTQREKKNYLFIFNSGSLWVVLKLPKTTALFSLINWVGSRQPTWTPKLNSNISHLHKIGWTSSITHPCPFYSTFEGHYYRQMGRVTMRVHL